MSDEHPLVTSRYGISREPNNRWGHLAWRHQDEHKPDARCESADHFRCRCSGSFQGQTPQCCQRATREDLRCDDCRGYCIGVTESKRIVPCPLVGSR